MLCLEHKIQDRLDELKAREHFTSKERIRALGRDNHLGRSNDNHDGRW